MMKLTKHLADSRPTWTGAEAHKLYKDRGLFEKGTKDEPTAWDMFVDGVRNLVGGKGGFKGHKDTWFGRTFGYGDDEEDIGLPAKPKPTAGRGFASSGWEGLG